MTLTSDSSVKDNSGCIELLQEMLNTMELDTGTSFSIVSRKT